MKLEQIVGSAVLAGVLAIGGDAYAEERPIKEEKVVKEEKVKTMQEIPYLSIGVVDWKPVDITDKVEINDKLFDSFLSKGSKNGNWWFIDNSKLDGGFGTHGAALVDCESKRAYWLSFNDENLSGLSSEEPVKIRTWSPIMGDNGAVLYDHCWLSTKEPEPGKDLEAQHAYIIADFENSRKVIIKTKGFGEWYDTVWPNSFKLSDDGNKAVLNSGFRDYLVDLKSGKILFQGKGDIEAMDHDASVLIYRDSRFEEPIVRKFKGEKEIHYDYYRIDLEKEEKTKVLTQSDYASSFNISRFKLSPDGNFAITPLRKFIGLYTFKGEGYSPPGTGFNVYVHSKGEAFSIRHVSRGIKKANVDNKGTLILPATYTKDLGNVFRLEYKDGNYIWATDWEKQPKHFSVDKYSLEDMTR